MNDRVVIAVPFVLCAALYASVMGGHFLSDDMAVLHALSEWRDSGELWSRLFSKFVSGLDAPSHYYRPFTFLSYGLNLTLTGTHPIPWHLVNLIGHLAAGAAVYRITSVLQPGASSRVGPAVAAALFLLLGTNAEAVAWISGRYDVFATAFSLWAALFYLESRSGFDRRELGALLCGLLALASKESGAVLPGLIACLAWIKHGESPVAARWQSIARDVAPWVLLIAGYFALRLAMFGSMLSVYPGASPLGRIADGSWMTLLRTALPWLSAALPSKPLLAVAAALTVALLATGLIAAARDRSLRRPVIGMLAAIVWSLGLLLPHMSGLPLNGEGGRIFYTTGALAAIGLGVLLGGHSIAGLSTLSRRLLYALGLALAGVHAALLNATLQDWRTAGRQMTQMVTALPALRQSLGTDGYAFIFVPDAIGAAPFARSAQGAIVLPPIQQQSLLSNLIVFTSSKLPQLPSLLQRQLVPVLKRYSFDEAAEVMKSATAVASASSIVWPDSVYCWRPDSGMLQKLELPETWQDARQWEIDVAGAMSGAGCSNQRGRSR